METIKELIQEIRFEKEKVSFIPEGLQLIGQGRSAAVFKLNTSGFAVKVFYHGYEDLAAKEAEIYRRLSNNHYYPELLDVGTGYLVMEYLEGMTFYDCLVKGIAITPLMVAMVDEALDYARSKGLNPSDIHLKNIMLIDNKQIKVFDVVRFTQEKDCSHWPDLKKAYYFYYQKKFFPKKYPRSFIEIMIRLYRKRLLPI